MLSEHKTLSISLVVALVVCSLPVIGFVLYALWPVLVAVPWMMIGINAVAFLVSVLALVVALRVRRRTRRNLEVPGQVQEVRYYQQSAQQPYQQYQQGYEQPLTSYPDDISSWY